MAENLAENNFLVLLHALARGTGATYWSKDYSLRTLSTFQGNEKHWFIFPICQYMALLTVV